MLRHCATAPLYALSLAALALAPLVCTDATCPPALGTTLGYAALAAALLATLAATARH